MPSLVVPESGLSLGSVHDNASKPGSAAPEVLGLTLSDNVIEDMIKCFQNGKTLQLSLGEHPSLLYGTKTQHLSTSDDPFTHELYRSTIQDVEDDTMAWDDNTSSGPKIVRVQSKPNAAFMGMFRTKRFNPALKPPVTASKASVASTTTSSTVNTDAALAQLKSSLATENAKKAENTTKYIKNTLPVPGSRKGGSGSKITSKKLLSSRSLGGDTPRSIPSSPALSGVGSPSLGPTSVPLSQQQAEKARAARKPVIHLLALGPTSERDLKDMLPHIESKSLKQALDKVGDLVDGKYDLRKSFYKELDVWSYDYPSPEHRQRAIDNAIGKYDKMRLGTLEPEWDRLLPKVERGTGKCLSKLQAQIARGDLQQKPLKIKLPKEDGSGRDTSGPEDESLSGDKKVSRLKGERNNSQQPTTKGKKTGEKETQARKLSSKITAKPTSKPATAQAKKERPGKAGGKVLSSEYVEDSDDEDDEQQQPVKPIKAAPRPLATTKRSREYDTESSDSNIPLSKKLKKDTPTITSHRISDASQSSRATNLTQSSFSSKTKDTSPQKSSPLASSPPTNASDVENSPRDRTSTSSSASPANHLGSKNSRSPIHKRHQKSSSVASSVSSTSSTRYLKPEVVDIARKYRSFYPKYEALHREIAGLSRRDSRKEQNLLDMHARLSQMKQDINAGIVEI